MLVWNCNLRYSDNLKSEYPKIVKQISNKKRTRDIFCIAYATNGNNLFDIYDANELKFPHYKSLTIHIVGLAKGRETAMSLVHDMLHEIYSKTGDFHVRDYFGK